MNNCLCWIWHLFKSSHFNANYNSFTIGIQNSIMPVEVHIIDASFELY